MKNLFFTIIFSISTISLAFGQSLSPTVIGSTGGFHEAGGHSLSFTVGEPVTETFTSGDNILTQGFQQPEVLLVSVRDLDAGEYFNVTAYPNPTVAKVFIEINANFDDEIYLQLYDVLGKEIKQPIHGQMINGSYTYEIDLSAFASGLYFARLTNQDGTLKKVLSIQKTR